MMEVKDDVCKNIVNDILTLQELEKDLYSANYLWCTESRQVFGGQIVGQALVAAGHTVPSHFDVRSMHGYFLLGGDDHLPIVYQVENTRDDKKYSDRIVRAKQIDKQIFMCMVSFQKQPLPVCLVTHQYHMPDVAPPEELPLYQDLLLQSLGYDDIPERQKIYRDAIIMAEEFSFHIKAINIASFGFFRSRPTTPSRIQFWIKHKGDMSNATQNMHQSIASYMSDVFFLGTALKSIDEDKFLCTIIVSLDHSVWFHNRFRVDDWLLYECESPCYVRNRALVLGRLWTRDGTLAVSVAQEGLIRFTSHL